MMQYTTSTLTETYDTFKDLQSGKYRDVSLLLQSNRMFFCEQLYCNIAMQCCNIDVQVARSKLQSL